MTVYNIKTDFGAVGNGTADDAQAFIDAGNALAGTSGHELYLPAGNYKWGSNPITSNRGFGNATYFVFEGITQILIRGDGSGLTTINMNGQGNQLAGHGQKQNGNNFGKVASVSKGSLTATLLDPSKAALYSANQYVLVAGLNIQDLYSSASYPAGYGYPANFQYFEYVKITAIDAVLGILTFATPLVNSYLSTWPEINVGNNFEVNAGGCAGVYSLPTTWNQDIEYRGITFADAVSNAQIYNGARKVTYRDCAFPNICPIPSQNETWAVYNSTTAVSVIEVDKLITNLVMDGCDWATLDFQSSSTRNVNLKNSTFRGLVGTGYDGVIDNCIVTPGFISPGCFAYGVSNSLVISNCQIDEWRAGGYTENGTSDAGVSPFVEMAAGVIKWPNGVSHVFGMADNGSGKSRFTVDNTGSFKVGQKVGVGAGYQELTTNGSTSTSSAILNFASVPNWIVAGVQLLGQGNGYSGIPDGATVLSKTSTTVTISANALSTINSGRNIAFACPAYAAKTPTILSIPSGTTIDVDIDVPSGFVWTWGYFGGGAAPRWAVPGKYGFFTGSGGYSKTFKVLGVTQDADYMYVQTDQPGGWPTIPVDSRGVTLTVPGSHSIRASGLTGSSRHNEQLMWSEAQGKPFGSYFKHIYTGSDPDVGTNVFGSVVKIVIDVTKIYSGAAANLFVHLSQFDNLPFQVDGATQGLGWGVNLKQPGTRVILPTNISSNATAKAGDSSLVFPAWSSSLWVNGATGYVLKTVNGSGGSLVDISGEDPSVWPSVTIEIVTDQGILPDTVIPSRVVPLCLRARQAA